MNLNRRVVELGEKCHKPVVAVDDASFIELETAEMNFRILKNAGLADADIPGHRFRHTTDEMLEEFSNLGEEKCEEVVITNPNRIAEQIGDVDPSLPMKKRYINYL